MSKYLATTKELAGLKVYGGRKGKRIGKVRHFVFHPTEKRLIGFTVKRPDAALMFKRKDLFVALGGYSDSQAKAVQCGADKADALFAAEKYGEAAEVYRSIGDTEKMGKIGTAIRTGFFAAMSIDR